MIGKPLYKAKVKDDKVIMESRTIVIEGRTMYHFNEERNRSCFKIDR